MIIIITCYNTKDIKDDLNLNAFAGESKDTIFVGGVWKGVK